MPSTATRGYGTIFRKVSGTNSTTIAQIRDLEGPEGEADDIDISNMDSANLTREFIKGFIDEGEVGFDAVYTKAQYAAARTMLIDTSTNNPIFEIELPDRTSTSGTGSVIAFPGYMKRVGLASPFEGKIASDMGVKVAGAVTFTPSA